MSKIARKLMKMFGSTAGVNQIGQFGSLAASSPTYVNDGNPDTIQALAAWETGWYGAVVGGNSPAIQDMNGLQYVFAYQLAYLFQAGIPEWNSGTAYYIGSFASDGLGAIYVSRQNDNTNHALSDGAWWARLNGTTVTAVNPATASPVTIAAGDNGVIYQVNSANGACVFNLPAAASISSGFRFTVKDVGGDMNMYATTIVRNASESIEGVAATYSCQASYGVWSFTFDGTNWWLE